MTKKRGAVPCPREPIGLSLEEAAGFVGMSATLFERLVREGVMPCPRRFSTRKIWDADELQAAFRRVPHDILDLKAGVAAPHDDHELDTAPRFRA